MEKNEKVSAFQPKFDSEKKRSLILNDHRIKRPPRRMGVLDPQSTTP